MKLIVLCCLVAAAAANNMARSCFSAASDAFSSDDFDIESLPPQRAPMPTEPFTDSLRNKVQTWADRFPLLKNLVEGKASKTTSKDIRAITNRGYLQYSQEVSLQAIEAVDDANYEAFTKYMLSTLEVPSGEMAESVTKELFQVIRWADNSDWVQYKATFSVDKLYTKYITILGHRNVKSNTYDFVVADFKNQFQLAPDILVVEERSSALWGLISTTKTRLEFIPPSLKKEDIEVLTNFFDMAAFTRFAKMLDVVVPGQSTFVDPITIIAGVNAGLDIFQKITQIFKTTIKSTILKEVMGSGFDYYVQRSTVQVLQGINSNNLANGYVPLMRRIFRLGNEVAEDVKLAVCTGLWADKNSFNKNDFLFNTDKNQLGNVRFIDVIMQKASDDEGGKFNLIVANVAQEFRLAPDIHIIEHSKSYVGGIYEKTDLEYRRIPRSLTEKDIEMLMAFFHVTVFKRIAAHMKVQIKYPDPPINIK